MGERFDAIIIGAGIIGTCIWLELARKSRRERGADSSFTAVGWMLDQQL